MPDVEIHYDELWKDAVENLFPHFIKLIAPDFGRRISIDESGKREDNI